MSPADITKCIKICTRWLIVMESCTVFMMPHKSSLYHRVRSSKYQQTNNEVSCPVMSWCTVIANVGAFFVFCFYLRSLAGSDSFLFQLLPL